MTYSTSFESSRRDLHNEAKTEHDGSTARLSCRRGRCSAAPRSTSAPWAERHGCRFHSSLLNLPRYYLSDAKNSPIPRFSFCTDLRLADGISKGPLPRVTQFWPSPVVILLTAFCLPAASACARFQSRRGAFLGVGWGHCYATTQ